MNRFLPHPFLLPLAKVVVDGGPVGQIMGHGSPGDAVLEDVKDGVHDLSSGHLGGPAAGLGSGDEGLQEGPLLVG